MRRAVAALVVMAVLVLVGVALAPLARQEWAWRRAAGDNSAESYARYLAAWPDGRHADEAARRKQDREFAAAAAEPNRALLEAYLAAYPGGRHEAEARDLLEDVIWADVQRANTVVALEEYLRREGAKYRSQAEGELDRLVYEGARATATIAALDGYLARFKDNGRYLAEARGQREDLRWQATRNENRVTSYEAYIREYPDGRYVPAARAAIEDIHWALVAQTNTIAAFRGFQARFSGSARVADAEARIAVLAADPAPWLAADRLANRKGYQDFLAAYPGHSQEATARDRLADMDGRNVFDLLSAGRISVSTKGNGVSSVLLTIQNKASHEIRVLVPAGTYFASANAAYQNMIAYSDAAITVRGNSSTDLIVSASCVNLYRDVPYNQQSMTMQRAAPLADLVRLAPVLARANPTSHVAQAAVWMLSDNATYAGLGRLIVVTSGTSSFFNQRAIDMSETVQAMRLLDDAGINIRTRAIWGDRQMLLNGLSEGPLKAWLQAKISGPTA